MTTKSSEKNEYPDLTRLFAEERKKCKPNDARINRIMHRIHHESNMNDLALMIFVRFWLTLLQLGAVFLYRIYKTKNTI